MLVCFIASVKDPVKPSSLLNGSEVNDLSSVNAMMSAVMSTAHVVENGANLQNTKSLGKCPPPNRIGRRNQVGKVCQVNKPNLVKCTKG